MAATSEGARVAGPAAETHLSGPFRKYDDIRAAPCGAWRRPRTSMCQRHTSVLRPCQAPQVTTLGVAVLTKETTEAQNVPLGLDGPEQKVGG
jgi:hypothetical protein